MYDLDELDGPVDFDYRYDCEECNPPIYAGTGNLNQDDEDCLDCIIEDRAQKLYNASQSNSKRIRTRASEWKTPPRRSKMNDDIADICYDPYCADDPIYASLKHRASNSGSRFTQDSIYDRENCEICDDLEIQNYPYTLQVPHAPNYPRHV